MAGQTGRTSGHGNEDNGILGLLVLRLSSLVDDPMYGKHEHTYLHSYTGGHFDMQISTCVISMFPLFLSHSAVGLAREHITTYTVASYPGLFICVGVETQRKTPDTRIDTVPQAYNT